VTGCCNHSCLGKSPYAVHCLCSTGSHILNVEVPKDQIYPMKLKGISICFSMLKAALCGNYVNFGVFRLYGDEALDNALNTFVKLLLSIPQSDLLVRLNTVFLSICIKLYLLLNPLLLPTGAHNVKKCRVTKTF